MNLIGGVAITVESLGAEWERWSGGCTDDSAQADVQWHGRGATARSGHATPEGEGCLGTVHRCARVRRGVGEGGWEQTGREGILGEPTGC